MYKTIEEIRKDWNDGKYTYSASPKRKVAADHIFDEELSVRKNREMVEEYNRDVEAHNKEITQKKNELFRKFTEDVIAYLMGSYNFSREVATKIEGQAYSDKHSCISDYLYYVDELGDIVYDCLELSKKK